MLEEGGGDHMGFRGFKGYSSTSCEETKHSLNGQSKPGEFKPNMSLLKTP